MTNRKSGRNQPVKLHTLDDKKYIYKDKSIFIPYEYTFTSIHIFLAILNMIL